jgi:hypothetical protein
VTCLTTTRNTYNTGADVAMTRELNHAHADAGFAARAADDGTSGAAGNNGVVVLSDRYWRSKFNGDRHVVGQILHIDGRVHEVIGITPASFYFPDRDALPESHRAWRTQTATAIRH